MIHINEWDNPDWITLEWDAIPPAWGTRPKRPPRTSAAPDPRLADRIRRALEAMADGPSAVHFHGGEGLRWIRVGFAPDRRLRPEDVRRVGSAIASCVGSAGPLYFHALRPHDLVFFLGNGQPDRVGMAAGSFGVPIDEVLRAWGLESERRAAGTPARAST